MIKSGIKVGTEVDFDGRRCLVVDEPKPGDDKHQGMLKITHFLKDPGFEAQWVNEMNLTVPSKEVLIERHIKDSEVISSLRIYDMIGWDILSGNYPGGVNHED